ncbi:hypothetical protein EV363DRAFT_211987 [Boletus edulis]|nr:hypothetical protein EV363DRAFT_211987 [Boletus edulis]
MTVTFWDTSTRTLFLFPSPVSPSGRTLYRALTCGRFSRLELEEKITANKLQRHPSPTSVVSLISCWKFDDLDITLRHCLCNALYAAGRAKEAGESLLTMMGRLYAQIIVGFGFLAKISVYPREQRQHQDENMSKLYAPSPLLKEWAKLKLTRGTWQDVLASTDDINAPGSGNP